MRTHIQHVSAASEVDFQQRLDDAMDEIQDSLSGVEIVQVAHDASITDELYTIYSALIVYRVSADQPSESDGEAMSTSSHSSHPRHEPWTDERALELGAMRQLVYTVMASASHRLDSQDLRDLTRLARWLDSEVITYTRALQEEATR